MLPRDFTGPLDDDDAIQKYQDELDKWQRDQKSLSEAKDRANEVLTAAQRRRQALSDWADALAPHALEATRLADDLGAAAARAAAATTRIGRLDAVIADLGQAYEIASARLLDGPPSGVPLVLFPLRLETHWTAVALQVRIYPDVISVDTHQPRLSPAESSAGALYQAALLSGRQVDADQAWAQLVSASGGPRAAWIVRATTPAPDGSPAPLTGDHPPALSSVSATARLLPERFAVVALADGVPVNLAPLGAQPRCVTWTAPVDPNPLPCGLLETSGGPDWMTDFDAAEAAGMAVTIPVPDGARWFDSIAVMGLCRGDAQPDIIGLLDAHAFTGGLEVLADGTPTNNSDQIRAAYGPRTDADAAHALISPPSTPDPTVPLGTAGEQAAAVLGVPFDRLSRVAGAGQMRGRATAACRLLVELGATGSLREHLGAAGEAGWPAILPDGPPTLRVGRQPYGLLPVTAPGRWQPVRGERAAALASQLRQWATATGPTIDIDPDGPPLHLGDGPAMHTASQDDTDLARLLCQSPITLVWTGASASFTGIEQLVGPDAGDSSPSSYLQRIADSPIADLPALAPSLATILLARAAINARLHATDQGPTSTERVTAALRALAALSAQPSGLRELADALTGVLDACSHRFDAWVTGAVFERLQSATGADGDRRGIGAFGWLTGIRPGEEPRSHGHVHAPSLAHAATAAVLRSGFLGQLADREAPDRAPGPEARLPLAVNLTSQRVRDAAWILASVRAGQPLGAVLGYQFERDLVHAGMAQHLAGFRKLSRFHTGTALEGLEEARRVKRTALSVARAEMNRLTAEAASKRRIAAEATQLLKSLEAAEQLAKDRAQEFTLMEGELRVLNGLAGTSGSILNLRAKVEALDVERVAHDKTKRTVAKRVKVPAHAGKPEVEYVLEEIDPDPDWVRAWVDRKAKADLTVQQAEDRRDFITGVLSRDPANSLLDAQNRASAARLDQVGPEQAANDQATNAEDAVTLYEQNNLRDAQLALEQAGRDISAALAELLRESHTSLTLTSTVDGLALRARYVAATSAAVPVWDHTTIPFPAPGEDPVDPELPFPAIGEPEFATLIGVLDRLDARADTIADLVTAEAVHHLVQGNTVRSGAALDVASTGGVPDGFDVIRTPITGHDIIHRVLIIVDPDMTAAWGSDLTGVFAAADPVLSAWASHLLPDPAAVTVTVRLTDPAGESPGEPRAITLDRLRLPALAWVRLASDPAEIRQRVARQARAEFAQTMTAEQAASARVVIEDTGPDGGPTLRDLLTAAAAVNRLLAAARALSENDLVRPATAAEGTVAAATVLTQLVAGVQDHVQALSARLEAAAQGSDVDALMDALFAASEAGEAAATPQLDDAAPGLAVLQAQANAVLPRLRARTASGPFVGDANTPNDTIAQARQRLAELCGAPSPFLAPVDLPARDQWLADLSSKPSRLADADPGAVRGWLHLHARVRPALDAMLAVYELAEALETGAKLDPGATQLSPPSGQTTNAPTPRWVGTDPAPAPGSVGFIVQQSHDGDPPATVTGLAVDAWTQTVPSTRRTTGVTFHYDEPDATAPQAVLIAVAPDVRPERQPETWDLSTLLDVLTSTMALARDRAVAGDDARIAGVTLEDLP